MRWMSQLLTLAGCMLVAGISQATPFGGVAAAAGGAPLAAASGDALKDAHVRVGTICSHLRIRHTLAPDSETRLLLPATPRRSGRALHTAASAAP